jgi:hypothetical protein
MARKEHLRRFAVLTRQAEAWTMTFSKGFGRQPGFNLCRRNTLTKQNMRMKTIVKFEAVHTRPGAWYAKNPIEQPVTIGFNKSGGGVGEQKNTKLFR